MSTPENSMYRFILVGEITFTSPGPTEEEVNHHVMSVNAAIHSDTNVIGQKFLRKSSEVLQINALQKIGEGASQVKIVDLVISNIIPLGLMTDAEYNDDVDSPVNTKKADPVSKKKNPLKVVKS